MLEKFKVSHLYGFGGIAVGFATCLTSWLILTPLIENVWSAELVNFVFPQGAQAVADFYPQVCLPVGVPLGVFAGYGTHLMLGPTL